MPPTPVVEWVNPQPDAVLEEIRVRSNPAVPTTLGLLAVTFQLALKHFRGQASDDAVAAAPTMAVPS